MTPEQIRQMNLAIKMKQSKSCVTSRALKLLVETLNIKSLHISSQAAMSSTQAVKPSSAQEHPRTTKPTTVADTGKNRQWGLTGEKCPKCGGYMIINKKYEECSERFCEYIKRHIT